jgi:hypothetical protein
MNEGVPSIGLDQDSGDLVARLPSSGETAVGVVSGSTIIPVSVPTLDYHWHLVGVADANGDPDVVMRDSANQTQVQLLTNDAPSGGGLISGTPLDDADWNIVGIADFNGDGNSDIAYQDPATGQVQIQFLDGNVPRDPRFGET